MKNEMKGFEHVFSFTFLQYWKGKNFLRLTIVMAVLCFLLPAVIMPLTEKLGDGTAAIPEENPDEFEALLERVYVVDVTDSVGVDMSFLNEQNADGCFSDIE